MKYTAEQKEKLLTINKEKFCVQFCIENRVKNNYPIKVEYIDGYFIVESKLNTM